MIFLTENIYLVSNNFLMQVALKNMVISAIKMHEIHRTGLFSAHISHDIIIIDISSGLDMVTNVNKLATIRKKRPEAKVILVTSKVVGLFFLNRFACLDVDLPLNEFAKRLVTMLTLPGNLCACGNIKIRTLTIPQICFLYRYVQGESITNIAKEMQVPRKTLFSRKRALWKQMEIKKEINISYLAPCFKRYFEENYLAYITNEEKNWLSKAEQ